MRRKMERVFWAKSPPGQITESKPQQQTIKTQWYLPLKRPFLRQERPIHFISMQINWLTYTHINPHIHTRCYRKTNAHTCMHMHVCAHTAPQTCPKAPLRRGGKRGTSITEWAETVWPTNEWQGTGLAIKKKKKFNVRSHTCREKTQTR